MSTMTNLTFILFLCCIFGVQNSLCKLQLNKSVKATFIRHFNSKSNSNSCVGEGYTCYNDSDCCSYSCNFNSCSVSINSMSTIPAYNTLECGTIGSYCLNDHSCCSYSCDLSICCSISDCTNDTDCCNRDSHFCINGFCQVRNL
uniref:Uncharacterized protein n=1 Tax=Acrobeloides nanus TaxID=290746 RepID=A0A914DLM5_9BILA